MRKVFVGAVLVLGVGYAVLSSTLDFNGDSLGRSLAGETGAPYYQFGCSELDGSKTWSCLLFDGSSKVAEYSVRRTDGTCWEARRVPPSPHGPAFPADAEGCVDAFEAVKDALGFGPDLSD